MKLTLPPQENDHALGPVHASMTLIEYGDFECPHSRKASGWMKEILSEDHDLRFIYRHYPLVDLHSHAVYAALASEGAGVQGRFWEFQQALFRLETPLTPTSILTLASALHLDAAQLLSDLDSTNLLEKVHRDLSSGLESGVQSTPGFFLNGIRLEGPLGLEHLKENIECLRRGRMLPA